MSNILVVDTIKSSIVMTSEIIKDNFPGSSIVIAASGKEALEQTIKTNFDLIIIDIDLPDTDGITLTKYLRRSISTPILITTFPEQIIIDTISKELFAYRDNADWLKKPVEEQDMTAKVKRCLAPPQKTTTHFSTSIDAVLTSTSTKQTKKDAPQLKGNIITLSINSALLDFNEKQAFSLGDEVTISILNSMSSRKKSENSTKKSVPNPPLSKLTAKVAWTNKNKKQVEFQFEKLNTKALKALESILKNAPTHD